jgi:hypothetical protein
VNGLSHEVQLRWRSACADLLRSVYTDVSEADVRDTWERFRSEVLPCILSAHPPRDGPSEEIAVAWLCATNVWIHAQALAEVLAEPGSGWASSYEVGPDGRLRQFWRTKGDPAGAPEN